MKKGFCFFLLFTSFLYSQTNSNFRPKYRGSYTLALDTGNVFLEGEYLYWKPYGYIPYFISSEALPNTNGVSLFTNRKEPQLSLKAHSGYRLECGFYLPTSSWYTSAQYTQFFAEGNDHSGNNDPTAVVRLIWPSKSPTSSTSNPVEASPRETLKLKILDGILSRSFKTRYALTFDPYFGFRYAKIKVDMRIPYSQLQTTGSFAGEFGRIDVDLNNHFNSYGLRSGFKTHWKLGAGFEVFGNASLSSLLGTFILRNRQSVNRIEGSQKFIFITTSTQKLRDIYLSYQLALGLIWGKNFNDKYYFGIKLGYETNIWPDFMRIQSYSAPSQSQFQLMPDIIAFKNNLSMHGLTASMRFDF